MVDTLEPRYLVMALVAFFLAVGIAAHALDELHGRPLRTQIPRSVLIALAVIGVVGALAIGLYGASIVSWWGLVFIGIGGFLVPAYNLEWFGGRFHTDLWFAVMWGGFPALAGGFSQTGRIDVPIVLVSAGCGYVAAAQRRLSTPVREPSTTGHGGERPDLLRRRHPGAARRGGDDPGTRRSPAVAVDRHGAARGGARDHPLAVARSTLRGNGSGAKRPSVARGRRRLPS